jgi:hypothetical protein
VQQNGGVVTPHVALGFGLQGNFIATSFKFEWWWYSSF